MVMPIFCCFQAELQKGESVCIDRCVAKYLEVHERIGKKLTDISMRDQVCTIIIISIETKIQSSAEIRTRSDFGQITYVWL